MNQKQKAKDSFGLGLLVWVPLSFIMYFMQPFGLTNLIGAIRTSFGLAFGFAAPVYVGGNNKAPMDSE